MDDPFRPVHGRGFLLPFVSDGRRFQLLSWNCRHIANAAIQTRLRRLVEAAGFTLPVICTPEELMESDNEQND